MTRVIFYVLGKNTAAISDHAARLEFACRLAEKAWRAGNSIFIAVNDEQEAEILDKELWQFRPESFIPHNCEHHEGLSTPVVIGCGEDCGEHHDLLINLRDQIPSHFSRFERLAEIVSQEQKVLTQTREHFTFYRQRGYPVETHNIG